jgi:regulator of sirC expression with transglutaminase-like and TPR domain
MMDYRSPHWRAFGVEVQRPPGEINLGRAALLLAATADPELDVMAYLAILDTMARELESDLPEERYPLRMIKAINHYLFDGWGFRGNVHDYYDPDNSFLHHVIDRRLGIPITLAVLYLELAHRVHFPMVGVGMPGHFLIRPDFPEAAIFVDPFHQGEVLFAEDCQTRLNQVYGRPIPWQEDYLQTVDRRQILFRMLTNLQQIYCQGQQWEAVLAVLNGQLLIVPQHPQCLRDRGLVYYQLGLGPRAIADLETYLQLLPQAPDREAIRQLVAKIR